MKTKRFNWYAICLHGVLALFAVLVLLLARENQSLEAQLLQATVARVAGGPAVDDPFPEVPVTDLDGAESVLALDDASRDSVVLVFTAGCPACKKNLEPWRDLHRRFGDRYQFVAVGLDAPETVRSYVEEHDLPFRVVIPNDSWYFQRQLGIEGVPQTLVVGADGRVKDVQAGILPKTFRERLG